jgi:predicted nuclease with RNAse H fold
MQTLGVDLASQPDNTGHCVLRWRGQEARVEGLGLGLDDAGILERARAADAVGIDAPFGWPRAFVELLAGSDGGGGPVKEPTRKAGSPEAHPAPTLLGQGDWTPALRDALRFRATDRVVRERLGRWPLSVSTDRIALCALRCEGILRRLELTDRSGASGRIFETYPALALRVWGLAHRSYKGAEHRERRRESLAALADRAPWLHLTPGEREALVADHDVFDALVAALIARAAALGQVEPVPAALRSAARREGWIQLPLPTALDALAQPA